MQEKFWQTIDMTTIVFSLLEPFQQPALIVELSWSLGNLHEIFYHLGNFAKPKFVFSMKFYRSATTDGKLNFGAKARIFSISSKLFFNMALYFRTFASTQAISFSDLSKNLWHVNLTQNENMIGYRKSNFTYHLRQLRSNRPWTILFCW